MLNANMHTRHKILEKRSMTEKVKEISNYFRIPREAKNIIDFY